MRGLERERGLVSNLIRVWGVVKREKRAGDAVPMREGNWWEAEVESGNTGVDLTAEILRSLPRSLSSFNT